MRIQSSKPITYIVSFPRSGHHGFVGFLDKVSNIAENYCEFYTCSKHNGQKIPCPLDGVGWQKKKFSCGSGRNILKCHDFDLSLPIEKEHRYVIQYRHPFYSIESWYKMETGKGKDMGEWTDFFESKLSFWKKFIQKWVLDTKGHDNVFLVPYSRLGNKEFIGQICKFMDLQRIDLGLLPPGYFNPKRKLNHEDAHFSKKEIEIRDYLLKSDIPLEFGAS